MKGIYTELKDKEILYLLDFKPDFIWSGNNKEKKLKQLHDFNIKVFQSIGVFCAQNKVEKQKYRAIDKRKKKIKSYKGWYVGLCPTCPEVQSKRLKKIESAFNSSHIDGVWLDSIRYPTYWETPNPEYLDTCYCKRCLSIFQKSGLLWKDFRVRQICYFIEKVMKVKNDKVLGYFAVPETDDKLEKIFAQPPRMFNKFFDYVSPMVYPQMVHKNIQWSLKIIKKFQYLFGKDRVIPIIQLVKMPDNSKDSFNIKEAKNLSERTLDISSNIGYFMLAQTLKDKSRLEMVQQFFA